MQNYLANANASRTFFTQSLLTQDTSFDKEDKQKKATKKIYDRDLVRTDSKSQSIDVFLAKPTSNSTLNNDRDRTTTPPTTNTTNSYNSNNNNVTLSEFTTLKSRFSSQSNSKSTPSSRVEIVEINKSNNSTLNPSSSDIDFSKSSLDNFTNKNTVGTTEDENENNDRILPLSEHNPEVFESRTTTHSKVVDQDDQDDMMIIEKPNKAKESSITNIEIFDASNIPNGNKRFHDDRSSSNSLSNKLNKKPKHTVVQEEETTIIKPIFNSNYLLYLLYYILYLLYLKYLFINIKYFIYIIF